MRLLFAAILTLSAITGCSSGTSTDSAEVILNRHGDNAYKSPLCQR
jgi:hypothetical protein